MNSKDCEKILADGVFEHYFHKTSENTDVEYRKYIETEQFKEDFKNGKFNLGLGVEIEGVPFKLEYGSDETKINKFVEKVKQSVEFKMSSQFSQVYQYSVANVALAEEYRKCLAKKRLGFDINYETTETSITFRVSYSNFGDIEPIFNEVFITPESKLKAQSIQKGEKLKNNSEEFFTFDLAKTTKEIIFTVDTNLTAQSLKVVLSKKGKENIGLPVGTIITSFLTWREFEETTKNNQDSGGVWKSKFSYWSPCDGRVVSGSEYQEITGQSHVPELRGLFLRGLNTFDAVSEEEGKISRVKEDYKDPEARVRGSFQIDTFKSHAHQYRTNELTHPESSGGTGNEPPRKRFKNEVTTWSGDSETRPKNAAVFYYIRIN